MTPEELEAQRLAEEAEAQRLAQEAAATNPMMQPTDLIGQRGQQETGTDTNPLALADLVNADRAQAASAKALIGEDTFVEPLDFAGEIQRNPTPYSGLVDNNPFTALGGTPVEENQYTVARAGLTPEERARIETRLARTNADILAENTPEEYRPIGGGFSFGGDIPIPRDTPEGATFMGDVSKLLAPFTAHSQRVGGFPAPTLDTALAEQGTTPALAEQGSPQAIFEGMRAKGPLSPELIAAGQKRAALLGTTFDPETGFSRDPFLQFQQAQQAQQAEREALANRPGYGYGGAVNDQYQSADFDTISQGVFDTPMTGMRPINSETGEPLSQGVIDAAARAGLELPMGSVPLPKTPVNSIPMGQDETRARLGGMTLNQYLNAPDGAVSGLRTDPQGRMIPGGFDNRADAYGQYEDEVSQAYQRQSERMQQRADQRDGTAGPRTYGGYTTSQLRGMVGGGDNLRAAQMRAEAGLNPVQATVNPMKNRTNFKQKY